MELVVILLVGGFGTLVVGAVLGMLAHRRVLELTRRLAALEDALRDLRVRRDPPARDAPGEADDPRRVHHEGSVAGATAGERAAGAAPMPWVPPAQATPAHETPWTAAGSPRRRDAERPPAAPLRPEPQPPRSVPPPRQPQPDTTARPIPPPLRQPQPDATARPPIPPPLPVGPRSAPGSSHAAAGEREAGPNAAAPQRANAEAAPREPDRAADPTAVPPSEPHGVPPAAPNPEPHAASHAAPPGDPHTGHPEPAGATAARGQLVGVEQTFGLRGLTWIGVGLLFLGVAFFLKYAYDRDWLGRFFGPRLRIATAAAVALALAVAGWRSLARGMVALGQGLLGGGQALLYLTVYAAFQPAVMVVDAPLLSATAAFVLMVAVTVAGLAAAVRLDAVAMAFLAVLGGFATPWLVGGGGDARDVLCGYVLLLDLGVLLVAYHRRWRALDLLAFAGTVVLFGGWWARWQHAHPQPDGTVAWLVAFHLVFLLLPFAQHWRHRTAVTVERFALALANVAWTFGYAAWLLREPAPRLLAALQLGAAALHVLLGVVTAYRVPADRRARDGFVALAILLLTLGVFHLLPGDATTAAWNAEAAVLLWLGYRYRHATTRRAAAVVLFAAVVRTLVVHLPAADRLAPLAWNGWFATLLVAAAGLGAFAAIHARHAATPRERALAPALGIAAGLWALVAGTLEILRHADGHAAAWHAVAPALAIAWLQLAGSAVFVAAARRTGSRAVFLAAFVPLLAAAIAVGVGYGRYPADAWPALNATCATGLAAVAVLLLASRFAPLAAATPAASRLGAGAAGLAQLAVTALATVETAAWLQRGGAAPPAATTSQALGWVWLVLALGGSLVAAAWGSRRVAALAAIPLALAALAVVALYGVELAPQPLLANQRFVFAALVAAVVAAQRPVLRALGAAEAGDHAAAAALALLLAYGGCEVVAWNRGAATGVGPAGRLPWLLGAVAVAGAAGGHWRALATTNRSLLGVAAVALVGASTLPLLVYTSPHDGAWMFVNTRAALVAAAVATLAWWARDERRRTLRWGALAVVVTGLTVEPPAWLLAHVADRAEATRLATFAVTVTWIVTAVVLLAIGFRRDLRAARLVALALFALTALKLLLLDMSGAQQLYRILAFVLVGLAFVGASWLYHRLARRLAARGSAPTPAP